MVLVVENGDGVWEANAYAGVAFVTAYLKARGRSTEWVAATSEARREAIVRATDYIDRRFSSRFLGQKQNDDLVVDAFNYLTIAINPENNSTATIGSVTYQFKNSNISDSYEVLMGSDAVETANNLVAAINATGTAGVTFGNGTDAHPDVTAVVVEDATVKITAKVTGSAGNDTVTFSTTEVDSILFDYDTLQNGQDEAEQILEWPRKNIRSRTGKDLTGLIPEKLRQAVAEYAQRALSQDLFKEPTVDETGGVRQRVRERVGPVETDITYATGEGIRTIKPIPVADRLLLEYLHPAGGLIR